MMDELKALVAGVCDRDASELSGQTTLTELELDSLAAVELSVRLHHLLGVDIDEADLIALDSLDAIAQYMTTPSPERY